MMFIRSCSILLFIFSALELAAGSRTCPRGCNCNDQQLVVKCDRNAQLDYVPHTLNPAVKELYLSNNNIRAIKSAFEVYTNLVLLDLSLNNLQNLGEKNFIANSKIETIILKLNNITDLYPNTFAGLQSLKTLDLSSNLIEILNGSIFQHAKSLKFLDLSSNNIKSIEKNAFNGLFNLTQLNISNNLINIISPESFRFIPNLINFNMSNNQLIQLFDDQFQSLNMLNTLDISNCQISNIGKFSFRGLNNLHNLFLDNNYLEDIPSHAFFDNNAITMLNIGNNRFQSIGGRAFSTLKKLRFLYISNNSLLNNIHYNTFFGLENLELLEMANNEMLSYIGRNVFDNLFSLSSLVLSNNNLEILEIDLITRYKKTDLYLDVRGNPLNCNCSLEWLSFHFIRMFNKTVSSNPEFFGKNFTTFNIFNMDALLNNNLSDMIIHENAMEVKCAAPFALENKLLIKLHKDKFGCFVIESFIPIIIGALFGLMIIAGVIALSIIRCKYRLSGFVKNQLYAENGRNQIDLYHKPEFVFVPNVDYNTLYKEHKMDDLTVRYPLRMTPITEL